MRSIQPNGMIAYMDPIQAEFIEKYQTLYEENPNSKVFAPLSEAYRKAGMVKEAFELCLRGVQLHPKFAGGHVALARLYIEKKKWVLADKHLSLAIEASPENILALALLADIQLKLRQPKKSLQTYKTLLFLNPDNPKAIAAVKKLESLTAPDFTEDAFEMKPVQQAVESWALIDVENQGELSDQEFEEKTKNRLEDRFVSLIDAHLSRNDFEKATAALDEAESQLGPIAALQKRRKLLSQPISSIEPKSGSTTMVPSRQQLQMAEKARYLNRLLDQIEDRRYKNL